MLSRKEEKKIWMPTMISVAASTARRSSESSPKPRSIQMPEDHGAATTRPASHDRPAEEQAVLEPEARAHAVEPGVLLAHEVGAVGVGAEPEREHLRADDHEQRSRRSSCGGPTRGRGRPSEASTVSAISAPRTAITAPGTMNRCVGLWTSRKRRWRQPSRKLESFDSPLARVVLDRDLVDLEPLLGRADHHLGGELHAGRAQVEARQGTSRRNARMPQWASRTPVRKKRLRIPVSTGLPT